jgi:phospholipid/cholesterol/gamma-HCH transport system substrate-binding protein
MFIVVALAILGGGVFLIGDKQFLFSATYRLNSQFQSVAGLSNGAEVRAGGIHVGSVRRIDLPRRPDQKVTVEMDLEKATRDVIKKDSVAAIHAEGLVGDKYIEITFGSSEAEKVKDGDTIGSEPPLEVSALVKKADQILNNMQGAVQNVGDTANNLNSISSKINQGRGTLGSLINDKQMYQRVNQGATAFQEDMEALKHNFLVRGFFKNRGYEDSAEVTKHEIDRLPGGPCSKTFAFDAQKIFSKPDTAKLKTEKDLTDAGRYLEQNKFGLVVVAGYAGMKGDADKDRELTQARASVVRDYLVQNFKLDDKRIKTAGLGKTTGDARVEILVYPVGVEMASSKNQTPVRH